nr:hypothetical protein [uncultured Prevotella sp.]
MKIFEALRALSSYPVPPFVVNNITDEQGLNPGDDITPAIRQTAAFTKAKAAVYYFLADAPNISQGGVTYSFSEDERSRMKSKADAMLNGIGASGDSGTYGYIGEDF